MGAFATSASAAAEGITGSGTANQVSVWASASSLGVGTIPFTSSATGYAIGSLVAEPGGVLSLTSTTQGFFPPRMTTAQRNSIAGAEAGLMVFNASQDALSIYTAGGGWDNVVTTESYPTTFAVGDILYASTTALMSRLAAVALGSMIISQGVGTAPVWSSAGRLTSLALNTAAFTTVVPAMILANASQRDGGWNGAIEIQGDVTNAFPAMVFGNQTAATRYGAIVWTRSASGSTNTSVQAHMFVQENGTVGAFGFFTNKNIGTTSSTITMNIYGNNVGIGMATVLTNPAAKLHVIATSEQLRVGYDTSNYTNVVVNSTGQVTYDAVGSAASFYFSDRVYMFNTRLLESQGADVASANNLVLGGDGNAFEITGTTQINLLSNLTWQNGAIITMLFTSTPTVKHATATSGTDITILLAGAADFVASAGDTLTLRLCEIGGTQAWREISRAEV